MTATTIHKYWDLDNKRVFFDWTQDRPFDEYDGQYTMFLPDSCKVYKKEGIFIKRKPPGKQQNRWLLNYGKFKTVH